VAQSTVRLIVDAQNAINPLRRVNDATKNLSKNTDKLKDRLNKSNRSLRESGRAAKSASAGVATLNKSLMPLIKALAAIAATRFVFINAADIETQRKSLEVLTGSLSKTNQIIKELQDFGAVTPFKSSELIEQTKRLKAFGFETNELVDTTKRLADVAGATGADLQGIATAFGQIRAKGKLQQEENLQLLERGVDITTELEKITDKQGEAFASAMRKGEIGADAVNQALINLTSEGGAFFKGASAQATTLNGKLSTLVDSVESLARTIGEQLSPAIKGALDLATKGVVAIEKIFSRFGDIGDIGLGNVAKAEQDARRDAARLTATRFGTNFKGESIFASKEENEFFKEQFQLLRDQNIEREKLRNTQFKEVQIIEKKIEKEKEHKDLIEGTTLTFSEGLIPATEFFNESLGETNLLVDGLSTSANIFNEELLNAQSETELLNERFKEIGQAIEQGLVSNLTDAVMGTQTLGQAAINILDQLKRKLVEVAVQKAVSGIGGFIGGLFSKGGGGSLLSGGNNFSSLFSGDIGFTGSNLLTFANGGRPPVGRASIVGESGPELFVPSTAGTIIPNNQLGGGSTNNIVVNVNMEGGVDAQADENDSRELGTLLGVAVREEIVKQQRPGGLLANTR
jgi:tape measure domain-containing protein